MGDKPVNYVTWWDAARAVNWLQKGAQSYGSSDATASAPQNSGAYAVGTATFGTAPAKSVGAQYWLPTTNEWYKMAFYKGGGTSAGYWDYGTASDTAPTAVTSGSTGIGSAGSTGNSANFNSGASWNGQTGNLTTVGTNGRPSAYGAFDMSGNVQEWTDLSGTSDSSRGIRGGNWIANNAFLLSASWDSTGDSSVTNDGTGFRVAAVPEPASLGLAALGGTMFRR